MPHVSFLRTSDGAQFDTASHVVVKVDPSSFAVALHDAVESLGTEAVTWPTHSQPPCSLSGASAYHTRKPEHGSTRRGLQLTHAVDGLGHLMRLNSSTSVLVKHHEVLLPAIQRREEFLELIEAHLARVIFLQVLKLRLNSQRDGMDAQRG